MQAEIDLQKGFSQTLKILIFAASSEKLNRSAEELLINTKKPNVLHHPVQAEIDLQKGVSQTLKHNVLHHPLQAKIDLKKELLTDTKTHNVFALPSAR